MSQERESYEIRKRRRLEERLGRVNYGVVLPRAEEQVNQGSPDNSPIRHRGGRGDDQHVFRFSLDQLEEAVVEEVDQDIFINAAEVAERQEQERRRRIRNIQIAQAFAPVDRVVLLNAAPESLFHVNKLILRKLSEDGRFLNFTEQGCCWSNFPSHRYAFLQPNGQVFFKSEHHPYPQKGSTGVSALYLKHGMTLQPVHILTREYLGHIYKLKEYCIKINNKKIPPMERPCIILKFADEIESNTFVREFVDYVNRVKSCSEHFPLLRMCYKVNGRYHLTQEFDVDGMKRLYRRITVRQHFQNLRGFATAYQRALQSHQANVQRFQDTGLVDMNYRQVLIHFNLETIEDYMNCIFIHLSELRRIRVSLRDAELEDANQVHLMRDIVARIQEFEGIANELLGVSNEYREYLYCLDTLLCGGDYKKNRRTPSGNVEGAIVGKVQNILAFFQKDSNFIGNYPTAREFLVDMLHRGVDTSRFEENVALVAKLEQASYLVDWLDNQYNQQPEVVI